MGEDRPISLATRSSLASRKALSGSSLRWLKHLRCDPIINRAISHRMYLCNLKRIIVLNWRSFVSVFSFLEEKFSEVGEGELGYTGGSVGE